jgi:stage V sporulation protein SpoVS
MARATVHGALSAATRTVSVGLDPAAGTGAFLVAMAERGLAEIHAIELDPIAAAVAQVALPRAKITVGDGLITEGQADIVVGNPPFVSPERQNKRTREVLRQRMPWLTGRFDLAVPFAAIAVQRVNPGGGVGLILPAPMMNQPYGQPLREAWITTHRITGLSSPTAFPGAQVGVVMIHMRVGAGPAPLPDHGLQPHSLLRLSGVPLQANLRPGDPEIVAHIRTQSIGLGTVATIDTGVVSHGSHGGKQVLLHDHPAPDRVPYVDAKDLSKGRTLWLDYRPESMHRAKSPGLFSAPKVLVQRIRGRGPVRAWVDRSGLYAGHTLTVVRPDDKAFSPELLHSLITDPLVDGLLRMERGSRLDLYPKDVRAIPVPMAWKENPTLPLSTAWGLTTEQGQRLLDFSLE